KQIFKKWTKTKPKRQNRAQECEEREKPKSKSQSQQKAISRQKSRSKSEAISKGWQSSSILFDKERGQRLEGQDQWTWAALKINGLDERLEALTQQTHPQSLSRRKHTSKRT
ncbi:hypothetical protein Tco_1488238, partial [Tanacetum coccineum]